MKMESHFRIHLVILTLALALAAAFRSYAAETDSRSDTESSDSLELLVGDEIRLSFPGAPELSGEQRIRRDGRITLAFVGEKEVIGYTSSQLEDKLLEWYDDQIVTKEVTVTLLSSTFPIYVQGTVLQPGEIMSDRHLTALEAVLKAGYDPKQANLKKVRVIRTEGDRRKNYDLDLQAVLEGEDVEPFFLKPSDIVMVPEKFIWTGRR